MLIAENLKPFLRQLLAGTISHTQLSELVQLSRSIVHSHLQHMRSSITHLCALQGLSLVDLSYDCIAEAFARNDECAFPQIENFANSLETRLDATADREVFWAFKSFLTRVADAQLARLFAQTDPAGAKIHRNIRDCIKNSGGLKLSKDFRGLVISPSHLDCIDHLESFPIDELEREFRNHAVSDQPIPKLLEIVYGILTQQSQFRRSVSLVDVVQVFKKVFHDEFDRQESPEVLVRNGLEDFEINRFCQQVEIVLKEKILLTYLARGKVKRQEAEAMADAFHDLIRDWSHDGEQPASLCEYLSRHIPLDEETYEESFRPKMEYLLRLAREEFAARLMRDV